MYFKSGLVFLVVFVFSKCNSQGYLPPYIKPCDQDNNFEACVKAEIEQVLNLFTRGIPELDVPSLDPIHLDNINIDGNGLTLMLSQAQMFGLNTAKLTNFKVSFKESQFELSFICNVTVKGKYVMDGKILILPIKGEGDATINAQNIEVLIGSKLTHYKAADGKEHLKLTAPNYTYEIEKTEFQFDNLFNGNKQLAEVTHKFANENWRQLMDDLAPPAIKQIVKTAIKAINKFLSKVTAQQIIKNYHLF